MKARWCTPLLCAALLVWGCGTRASSDVLRLRIRGDGARLSAAEIAYEPSDAVLSVQLSATGELTIERRDGSRELSVRVPGFCPVKIPSGPQAAESSLVPVIELGGDRPPLGFDAPFVIAVRHGCPEIGRGQISWRQIGGVPLRELAIEQDGFELRARTASLEQLHPEPLPDGIVPFSARTQGRVVLEASWRGPRGEVAVRSASIPATSRASGLPSVSVSQQLVLSDARYRVKSAPQGGHAQTSASGGVALFTPDAPGRWILEREDGHTLSVQALWHDKTPYDCGRSECHAQIAATTAMSPMSHALARALSGAQPNAAVGCRLDCHVLGERGLDDGGFLDVANELGLVWLDTLRWQDLPQALRRLGGVRCTACHGPGAIPEPAARAAIVRADVCATCHDAPPRYVHVAQWRASRMARSDAAVSTRQEPCAGCHTTSGFLASIGARAPHAPQPSAAAEGIACAACHAPHSSHRGARLVRVVPEPLASAATEADGSNGARAGDPVARLCVRCHAPVPGALQPSAAAAALQLGSVRVPSAAGPGWELVRGPAVHGAVPQGCVGCHGGRASAPNAVLDHSFRVEPSSCAQCHSGDPAEHAARTERAQRELRDKSERLRQKLAQHCALGDEAARSGLPHANPVEPGCSAERFTRALYEVRLVLEDPAAAVHNAAFARELLRDAERQLVAAGVP